MSVARPAEGERLELVLRRRGHRDHALSLSHLTSSRLRLVLEPMPRAAARPAPDPAEPEAATPEEAAPEEAAPAAAEEPAHRPRFMDPWR